MKLSKRIELFYKLATKEDDDANYKWIIETRLTNTTKLIGGIDNHINYWKNKPQFRLEDFLPQIYKIVDTKNWLDDSIGQIHRNFGKYSNDTIKYVLEHWIKEHQETNIDDYLVFDHYANIISPATLRQAQTLIIRLIFTLLGSENDKAVGIHSLSKLVDHSTTFSKSFLSNIAKHFGLDTYTSVMFGRKNQPSLRELEEKPKLKLYDIVLIYGMTRNTTYRHLKELLNKLDDRARDYVRGFLYEDATGFFINANKPNFFILTEDLEPMDINYNMISWPSSVRISTLNEIKDPDLKAKWADVFANFKIIAQNY